MYASPYAHGTQAAKETQAEAPGLDEWLDIMVSPVVSTQRPGLYQQSRRAREV